jgi:hypothetical protein
MSDATRIGFTSELNTSRKRQESIFVCKAAAHSKRSKASKMQTTAFFYCLHSMDNFSFVDLMSSISLIDVIQILVERNLNGE